METNNITDMLRESVFFTARKARLTCNTQTSSGNSASSSDPASSSSQYYSVRIHALMERMSEFNMNQEDAEYEASKDHWTELDPKYYSTAKSVGMHSSPSEWGSKSGFGGATEVDLELLEENAKFIKSLQRENPDNNFFHFDDGEWVLGRKIGEGGQAEIYEVDQFITPDGQKTSFKPRVLKVFKAGYSLVDLQKQWPLALLHQLHPSIQKDTKPGIRLPLCHEVWSGRLLKNGRFAFEMPIHWGDLRKFMDFTMQNNGNQHPPFMMSDGNYYECCMLKMMWQIAAGTESLHKEATLHRDLKTSNLLLGFDYLPKVHIPRIESSDFDHRWTDCDVADFECAMGVVGTHYWRAPEILEAVKNRTWSSTPNLFTPKTDVYSYAMTCYEILTGFVPFEGTEDTGKTSHEDVIKGKRPKLPEHLRPWIKELLCKCWHTDPSKRPTFEEIVNVLRGIKDNDPGCQSESKNFKFHCFRNPEFKIEKKQIDSYHAITGKSHNAAHLCKLCSSRAFLQ